LRKRVIAAMELQGISQARTEVRTCGWLAQVDENGGSIFHYRPYSKGAADMGALVEEVLALLGQGLPPAPPAPATEALADLTIDSIDNNTQQHEAA